MSYRELLVGCGSKRDKRIDPRQTLRDRDPTYNASFEWQNLQTLDYHSRCRPDIVWDIGQVPWCWRLTDGSSERIPESTYDEIHAYEVLEHVGQQGDWRAFFRVFAEIWRLLKPGGLLSATCPSRYSAWLWGDPGHTQAVTPEKLIFLSQKAYADQEGSTSMSDYRDFYRADFNVLHSSDDRSSHLFVLQAVKPSRWFAFKEEDNAPKG